jgi:nicotinamide-nucleotide adenylyltransferase
MTTALFIGRFQPFHAGHLKVVKGILAKHERLIIMIGSSDKKRTSENPLDAAKRRMMIACILSNAGLRRWRIVNMPDRRKDEIWTRRVLKHRFDVLYSGNPQVVFLMAKAGMRIIRLRRYGRLSSSRIRADIRAGRQWKDKIPCCHKSHLDKFERAVQRTSSDK